MSLGLTKILRDLWLNRARSGLVILAIALSVMAFGVLNTTRAVLLYNFNAAYANAEPAHAVLTLPEFGEGLVERVQGLPETRLVEGRRVFNMRLVTGGKMRLINVAASDDPLNTEIVRLAWHKPPPQALQKGDALFDSSFVTLLPVEVGQTLDVEDMSGKPYALRVAGLPNDLISMPSQYIWSVQAFVDLDTAESLGQSRQYNQLLIVTKATGGSRLEQQAEIQRQVTRIVDVVEKAGYPSLAVEIPMVNQPLFEDLVRALLLTLQIFGFLIVLLAVMVVSNVAAALIAEQTRQVGILKAVGSRSSRVLRIYSQMVVIIGGIALVIAIPLVWVVTRLFVNLLAGRLDTEVLLFEFPLSTWISMPLLAFGATLAAVISPLWRASRLSVREALSDESPRTAGGKAAFNAGSLLVRSSLRGLLRKRQRLVLNLLMLGLAGAMFVTALNVRREIQVSITRIQQRRNFDIAVMLDETVRRAALERTALNVAGVASAKGVLMGLVDRSLPDGTLTGSVEIQAVPSESDYAVLWLTSGQWPAHPDGLVLDAEVMAMWGAADAGQIAAGKSLDVSTVVRHANRVLDGIMGRLNVPTVYGTYEAYAAMSGQAGMTNVLAVRLNHGVDGPEALVRLRDALEKGGYSIKRIDYVPDFNAMELSSYDVMVYSLFAVVALTALVGGLGLFGTLSISVMERRREIGILRSMGARPARIRRLILTEGVLIGLLSLPLSYALSWPLTLALGRAVMTAIAGVTPQTEYLPLAALVWAGLVVGLALLASWLPARQAGRLSIRETLIYLG